MTCENATILLDAYLDNELDVSHVIDVEQHLRTCATCSQALKSARILSNSIRNLRADEKGAPERLRYATRARLRQASRGTNRGRLQWAVIPAAAAVVTIAVFLGPLRTRDEQAMAHEVMASHVRSLMPNHLLDVPSSDQHTVKPWFAGKIDYSPPVLDFKMEGFPLAGGRLDYIASRPVAVLVYKRRQHTINCYVWPESGSDTQPEEKTDNGYHIDHWRSAGMEYWVVSDLNKTELKQFANLIRKSASS